MGEFQTIPQWSKIFWNSATASPPCRQSSACISQFPPLNSCSNHIIFASFQSLPTVFAETPKTFEEAFNPVSRNGIR